MVAENSHTFHGCFLLLEGGTSGPGAGTDVVGGGGGAEAAATGVGVVLALGEAGVFALEALGLFLLPAGRPGLRFSVQAGPEE